MRLLALIAATWQASGLRPNISAAGGNACERERAKQAQGGAPCLALGALAEPGFHKGVEIAIEHCRRIAGLVLGAEILH